MNIRPITKAFDNFMRIQPEIEKAVHKVGGADALNDYIKKRGAYSLEKENPAIVDAMENLITYKPVKPSVFKTDEIIKWNLEEPAVEPKAAELANAKIESAIFEVGRMNAVYIYRMMNRDPFPKEVFIGYY